MRWCAPNISAIPIHVLDLGAAGDPGGWVRLLGRALPYDLDRIEKFLDEAEDKAERSREFERDWSERQRLRRRLDEDALKSAMRDLLR